MAWLAQVVHRANSGYASRKLFKISTIGALFVFFLLVTSMFAQSTSAQNVDAPNSDEQPAKAAPVLSAGMGFVTNFEGGQPHLDPLVSPVILIPFGDKWLIESRDTFESDLVQLPGRNSFHGVVEKEVDYLQLDFIANPYLTVTIGRFLTPFGVYNERLYPIWIRNLQSDPLILPLATGPSGAGTGAMIRGGIPHWLRHPLSIPRDSPGDAREFTCQVSDWKWAAPFSICCRTIDRIPLDFISPGSRPRCLWTFEVNSRAQA
jgi:hypothetical protein